uniref:GIT1_C domain-containing protein n=1 Tax=Caenorhabditis tropicalis TaxID=1561998 RepID=A0A1I7TF36_9PELO
MGPEMTPEQRVSVSEDLELAVTCLKRAMHGMKATSETTDEPNVICTLQQITGALERCMENNRVLNDVLSGKIRNPACMEQNNSSASMVVDFNSSLSDVLSLSTNSTPTKQMVAAP